MADVPVKKERSPERERSLSRRGEWSPGAWPFGRNWPFNLSEFFSNPWGLAGSFGEEMTGAWSPSIEVRERDRNLIVTVDLPGLNKDDVKIEVSDGELVIRGERKREHEEKREGYYRSERSYGTFYRVIPLPEGAKLDEAKAQFNDGVLEVSVPVPESAKTRREIPIEAGTKARTSGSGR